MRTRERGIALSLVLWVLVIGAALLTVVLFLVVQEQRGSLAGRRLFTTFTRAEAGLADVVAGWTPGALNRALPGALDSLTIIGSGPGAGGRGWNASIRRLNQGLFLVALTAGDVATRARLGRLVRVRPVPVAIEAALTSGGEVRLGAAATISGQDRPPADTADCPPPDSAVAGIAAPAVLTSGSPEVTGSPPVFWRQAADSGLDSGALRTFRELAAQATLSLSGGSWVTAPATVGTVCSPEVPGNWGDPAGVVGACGTYMPIVRVAGDLELLPGRGQGILLVEGNLLLHGPYLFSGLVMVLGRLDVVPGDTGVRLGGAVLAGSVGQEPQAAAVIEITYSKCLVSNALLSSGRLIFLRSRSWKQLY